MKKKLIIAIVIFVFIIILIVAYKFVVNIITNNYESKMTQLTISNVNMSKLVDGTYKGNYEIFPIIVEVKLVVKNKEIIKIDIVKHQSGEGKPAEKIVDKVIEKQSLNVDTISGATGSSKVILKAIEIALNKAVK